MVPIKKVFKYFLNTLKYDKILDIGCDDMTKKRKNIFYIYLYSIIAISLVTFLIFFYYVKKIDILPSKYLCLFLITELILIIIEFVFAKFKKKTLYIISFMLSILLIIINLFGLYYVKHHDLFIDKGFTGDVINLSTFYLITNSDNKVENINDVTLDIPINYYNKSINNNIAREKLGIYNYKEVDNLRNYFLNFEDNNYLLIDKINYRIFIELNNDIKKEKFKVIYEFDIETVEKRNYEVKTSYNIFVMGKDFSNERDDLNMLITVNTDTNEVLFTGMPRDYYIDVFGYDFKDSLTNMYALGDDTIIKSIENFYQTTVDYKVILYTENLVDIVDKIGGVEFCSDKSFKTTHAKVLGTYDDTIGERMYVKKGCYIYNGIETLTIARERIAFNPKGDRQRQDNCRKILINILKKIASISTLSNYTDVLNSLNGLYKTNMNRNAVVKLIRSVIEKEYKIIEQKVGGEEYPALLGIERWKGSALYPNMKEVERAIKKIKEVLGE